MLTELRGKGGNLCSHAKSGQIRCPLMVRPTSEDVVTGNLFQSLGYINPRWWLPDLLNEGLGAARFRRQVFRRVKIRLWVNQPCYPRDLLPWDEGSTQVDAVITWENPPTTVFIEAKYGSTLSASVSADDGRSGFPSDQLIRNIRVGLLQSGYFDRGGQLFDHPPRDFVVLVVAPATGNPLVHRYRNPDRLRAAIPHADRLTGLPRGTFIGELGYADIIGVLRSQARWYAGAERQVGRDLSNYLEYKMSGVPARARGRHAADDLAESTSGPLSLAGLRDE